MISARLPTAACAVLAALVLASCGTVDRVDATDQQIRVDTSTPVGIDIENFHGNVRVVVDPTLTAVKPVIKKRVSWLVDQFIREDAQAAISVRSRTVEQDGRSVVTIRTSTKWVEADRTWVDVTLFVPRCDGVRIWNRGGKVTLEGVAGAIQVENVSIAGGEAPIEVRTDRSIVDPVMLVTDAGTVAYQVGPGSAGQFTLDSADGSEELDCSILRPDQIYSDGKVTTASINAGDNQVLLRTGKGSVIALVMRDPMSYTNQWR
jgi:hypothetical protein